MRIQCRNCNKVIEGRGSLMYCGRACAKEYRSRRAPNDRRVRATPIKIINKEFFDWREYDNHIII